MEKHENSQPGETTADIIARELTDERNDPAFVEEYLKTGFLSSAIDALFYARRQAGLTQTQLAERLHTKQASIARLEADTSGSLTLRRYVEIALACGVIPHQFTFTPIETARSFLGENPEMPLTFENQLNWSNTKFRLSLESGNAPGSPARAFSSATTLQDGQSKLSTAGKQGQALPLQERAVA